MCAAVLFEGKTTRTRYGLLEAGDTVGELVPTGSRSEQEHGLEGVFLDDFGEVVAIFS